MASDLFQMKELRHVPGIQYLDLPAGTRVRILTKNGNEIVVLTIEERDQDPLFGNRWHPVFGEVQYVQVLKAPVTYHGPAIMLAGQLEGRGAETDLEIRDAATQELAPGVTVLLGRNHLVIAEVEVI
jgi:hypothetical protein